MDTLTSVIIAVPLLIVSAVATIIFYWVLPWLMIPTGLVVLYVVLALVVSGRSRRDGS